MSDNIKDEAEIFPMPTCPVCHNYIFHEPGQRETCPVCGWVDDPIVAGHVAWAYSPANGASLRDYRKAYAAWIKDDPDYLYAPDEYEEFVRIIHNWSSRANKNKDKVRGFEEIICPICHKCHFLAPQDAHALSLYTWGNVRCPQCGWRYDINQYYEPDSTVGFNKLSVKAYRKAYQKKLARDPSFISLREELNERHLCPLCGRVGFEAGSVREICPVCGWQDDGDPEYPAVFLDTKNTRHHRQYYANFCRLVKKDPHYLYDPVAYQRYLARHGGKDPLKRSLKWLRG